MGYQQYHSQLETYSRLYIFIVTTQSTITNRLRLTYEPHIFSYTSYTLIAYATVRKKKRQPQRRMLEGNLLFAVK